MNVRDFRFVITGAAQGIGASTARVAAKAGARVILSDVDDAAGELNGDPFNLPPEGTPSTKRDRAFVAGGLREIAETDVELVRAAVIHALWSADAAAAPERAQAASVAKAFAAEAFPRVGASAIQVFGGYGYITEYPVERLWRDAKLLEIGGGTLESHQKNLTKDLTRKVCR